MTKRRNPMAAKCGSMPQFGLLVVLAILSCTGPCTAVLSSELAPRDPGPLPPAPYRYYEFDLQYANVSVNCHTKSIVTVNGKFPGPIIYANEGDRVIVNVTNSAQANMTIHFHGVRQVKSPWMDGVAFITQCPIQPGDYFVHDFIIPTQRGTLLWHAHYNWQRATVHGAFITYPTLPYPFPRPYKEVPMILGEWWYNDVEKEERYGLDHGSPFNVSDASTINGNPGPTYNCSKPGDYTIIDAIPGKTYLLRIVNAALNTQLYFSVANHILTVVEADGEYVTPFQTPIVLVGPGQTTNVLLTANMGPGTYYISISGFGFDDIPVVKPAAIFRYPHYKQLNFAYTPTFPAYNDTGVILEFTNSLKTLYPWRVPLHVNRELFFVVGLGNRPCKDPLLDPPVANCTGAGLYRIRGEINNVTFILPKIPILQASYYNISGVFTEDFPDRPEVTYDWTAPNAPPSAGRLAEDATRIVPIKFNDTVQIILQDEMIFGFENHPFHMHGHNFYVLGQGFGNYDPLIDPLSFNLYDPPLRNTVGVPFRGWVVIRWKANNPGVWLFHCHLDKHTSWGMQTVFHVHNGNGTDYSYNPPPHRLVPC